MFPSQTLRDPDSPPFRFRQQPQGPRVVGIEKLFRDHFKQLFGENDMAVFVFIICVTIGVVDPEKGIQNMDAIQGGIAYFSIYSSSLLFASFAAAAVSFAVAAGFAAI